MDFLLVLIVSLLGLAAARNVTVDNTSPLVVFNPLPCYLQDVDGCSIEWQLQEVTDAFNGSFTTTTGLDPSLGLDVLPRASLSFQGTYVLFMPGMHSTAQASVVVDDLDSVLVNTSTNAFSGSGLDPARNHTITITFVPSSSPTTLDVDYFLVMQPDSNGTTSTTSSFFTTPLPTSLPPTSTPPPLSSAASSASATPAPTPLRTIAQSIPSGTIIAVSLSGALLLLLGLLTCLYAARRRRRRAAFQREKAILYDLRLPSERGSVPRMEERSAEASAWRTREKGKARETDAEAEVEAEAEASMDTGTGVRRAAWRGSILPPVHYTPWR